MRRDAAGADADGRLMGWSWPFGSRAAVCPRRLADDVRVYAIGDVHGRLDLLDDLLTALVRDRDLRPPAATEELVLLGDLIDRGPASAGVVARARAGFAAFPQTTVLMGNHEEVLLRLLEAPTAAGLAHYLRIGGSQTLESYGAPERLLELAELHEPAELTRYIPAADRAWLASRPSRHRVGDYLFVHAGIRPGVALDAQADMDLRWIRGEFLRSTADHGVTVVHGHTVVTAPVLGRNRIGIDTGAWTTGVLTAVGLQGMERWLVATDG